MCAVKTYVMYECIYTEQMLRNGEVEMQARDEEIRFLGMQLAEDKRTLSLMQRHLPSKAAMERDIVSLQIQVTPLQYNSQRRETDRRQIFFFILFFV